MTLPAALHALLLSLVPSPLPTTNTPPPTLVLPALLPCCQPKPRSPCPCTFPCTLCCQQTPPPCPAALQAEQLTRLVGEFYTQEQKYSFVHAFNHRQSEFDFKRMLDSMGHATAELPRD